MLEQHWATQPEIDTMLADLEAWSEWPDTFTMFVLLLGARLGTGLTMTPD